MRKLNKDKSKNDINGNNNNHLKLEMNQNNNYTNLSFIKKINSHFEQFGLKRNSIQIKKNKINIPEKIHHKNKLNTPFSAQELKKINSPLKKSNLKKLKSSSNKNVNFSFSLNNPNYDLKVHSNIKNNNKKKKINLKIPTNNYPKININYFNTINKSEEENNKLKKITTSKSYLNNYINKNDKTKIENNIIKLQNEIKILFKLKTQNITYIKPFNIFRGFSAVSFKNFEDINEDKLHIGINNKLPLSPNTLINLFSIYDGHKGDKVSIYLKDNFHHYLFKNEKLFDKPEEALIETFEYMEKNILKDNSLNKYGSSILVLLNIEKYIYIANLGDCRAIISIDNSFEVSQLSKEHNIFDINEKNRIVNLGGMIKYNKNDKKNYKIMPGDIPITRCIGDIKSKSKKFGGIPEMISSIPDIIKIKYNEKIDYIILISSGIIEYLNNIDIAIIIYEIIKKGILNDYSFEKTIEIINQNLIYTAIEKGAKNNLSFIFICMNNLYKVFKDKKLDIINKTLSRLKISFNNNEEELMNNYYCKNNNVLYTFIEEIYNPFENKKSTDKYKSIIDDNESEKSGLNSRTKRTFIYDENKKDIRSFSNSFIKTNLNEKILSSLPKKNTLFCGLCCK